MWLGQKNDGKWRLCCVVFVDCHFIPITDPVGDEFEALKSRVLEELFLPLLEFNRELCILVITKCVELERISLILQVLRKGFKLFNYDRIEVILKVSIRVL